MCHAFKQVDQVGLNTQHDDFGFGVSHTNVVFDHHRFSLYVDQSQEYETLVRDIFFFQTFDGGFYDALFHFFMNVASANGTGETAPMPPVLSPVSPFPIRL